MDKLSIFLITGILSIGLINSCQTTPGEETPIESIEDLITSTTSEVIKIVKNQNVKNLAVYYFTTDGEPSPISDFLINSLTTSIANKINAEELDVNIVSRKSIDQILEELSFQMSDLSDESAQLQIGNLLGADVILSGSITTISSEYQLNAQLIKVETGVVVGGILTNFRVEEDIARLIEKDKSKVTEIITYQEKEIEIGGYATSSSVFETFDADSINVQVDSSFRMVSDNAEEQFSGTDNLEIVENSSSDNSSCLEYSFNCDIPSEYTELPYNELKSKNCLFTLVIKPEEAAADRDGICFYIKPSGFHFINIVFKQDIHGYFSYHLPMTFNEDRWHSLKIPFYKIPGRKNKDKIGFMKEKPFEIQFRIPFFPNHEDYYFRQGDFSGKLNIDNIGYFNIKDQEDPAIIESFNDEINRIGIITKINGTFGYWVFSEESGDYIRKNAKGIKDQKISIQKLSRENKGNYLNIQAEIRYTEEFTELLKNERFQVTMDIRYSARKDWSNYNGFILHTKSNTLKKGSIGFHIEKYGFNTGIKGSKLWSKNRILFEDLMDKDIKASELLVYPKEIKFFISYIIPDELIINNVDKGKIVVDLSLDDFVLTK